MKSGVKYYWSVACIVILMQGGMSQERPFGIGLMLGEPSGISVKVWNTEATAVVGGIGWSIGGDRIGRFDSYDQGSDRVHIHLDYLWHSMSAIRSVDQYPVYAGIGARMNSGAGIDASFAIRGVMGILWIPPQFPIDLFLELIPMVQITASSGLGLDAGVGARYFF